ncbi:MAG: NnrU family protein [Steroidobacteraceae bacterium]
MNWLIVGIAGFLGIHSIAIVAPGWRARTVAGIGAMRWKALYSIASLAAFATMLHGYGQARLAPEVVYVPTLGMRHLAFLLMLPVFPLLLSAYLPGRLRNAVGHPMLTATILWAVAHLLANGARSDLVLFGGFLLWAVADRVSVSRRDAPPARRGRPLNDAIAIGGGLLLYVAFVAFGHGALVGVPLYG